MIPQEDIEQVLNIAKIEEVIETFVPLRRSGANFVGLCPFHDEKTPSFSVNPSRGIFKCFGCGKGGNAVSFLMDYNHYGYAEAIRWLAKKYGIVLHETQESEEDKKKRDEKDELYAVNEFAQKYFYDNLINTQEGKTIGLSYLREREINKQTIDDWGIGYCLQKSDDFAQHALHSGYTEEVLIKSGLCLRSEKTGTLYDRFHSRITFPIYSVGGRVLGFSARILSSDKKKAKYVNSPESPIYTKGKVLFGLYSAKSEISKKDECYLVEGNIDAVMMSQNGIKNIVASSGTALTQEQVRMIRRYTKNVVILYDGDSAGIHATIRATDIFLTEGLNVKTVLFPEGDDPDSFARKHTQDEFVNFLKENAQNFIIYRANLALEQAKNDPIKKASLVKDIIHSISLIPDMVERSTYIQQCASVLEMEENLLNEELSRQIAHNIYQRNKQTNTVHVSGLKDEKTEQENNQPQENVTYGLGEENQERSLIKILLLYADKFTRQTILNIDNRLVEERVNAGEYVLATILADDIKFNNPSYQKIFDIFLNEYTQNRKAPNLDLLLNSGDEQIKSLTSSLLVSKHKTSPLWQDKYNVHIPDMNAPSFIDKEIKETLLYLKFRKLEAIIKDLRKQLQTKQEQPEAMAILQKIVNYTQQLNLIARELKIIVK